jgi:hypothetical protein
MCHSAGAPWMLSQIASAAPLPDAHAAGLPLFHFRKGQDGSYRREFCAGSFAADHVRFVRAGFFFYHSHRSQTVGFGRLVSSSASTPDLKTTHRKPFLVRRRFCVTSVIWLRLKNRFRRIYMKKLTMSVLSLAALVMLTFGSTFAKSAKADCCNGSSCCHSGAACCHRK